jgi:probable HAF family extracellular repeat protein
MTGPGDETMPTSDWPRRPRLGLLCLATVILLSGPVRADFSFTVADLGTLPGGNQSQGMALNISGQVAGTATTRGLDTNAFSGGGTSISSLGTLPGGVNSEAFAINNLGSVAGDSEVRLGPGDFQVHAFRSGAGGGLLDLQTYGHDVGSAAYAINDADHIAGASFTAAGTSRAVIGMGVGAFRDLGNFGGPNAAGTAINDNDVVAGWAQLASGARAAFRTNSDGTLQNLGTLAGFGASQATGINAAGDVVGFAGSQGASRAFLEVGNNPLLDLGILANGMSAQANGLNDNRAVVGEVDYSSGPSHGFLWDPVSQSMLDINSLLVNASGYTVTDATGINDHGQITGTAMINGGLHAVLLTPTGTEAVPEPSSWLLLLGGGAGLFIRRGLRRGRTTGRAGDGRAGASRAR